MSPVAIPLNPLTGEKQLLLHFDTKALFILKLLTEILAAEDAFQMTIICKI